MWYDSAANLAKVASQRTDTGSLIANQADFAGLFLGVSSDQRLAVETVSQRRLVTTDGVFLCDCPSSTFTIGDLVGIDRTATPLNNPQQVVKVTNPALAIGVVVKDEAVATTQVKVRLTSRWCFDAGYIRNRGIGGSQGTATLAATDADTTLTAGSNPNVTMIPTAARKLILPNPIYCAGLMFFVNNNSAGAFAINLRDNTDATTLQAIPQNKRAIAWCDGTTWFALLGA